MAFLWTLVGLVVGPFLSRAIYRLPRSGSRADPSACSQCHGRQPLYLQSALLASLLRARGCPECGTVPSRVALAVELAGGATFGLLSLRFGADPKLFLYSLYSCALIVVSTIDWQHRLILNRITYPGTLLAVILTSTLTPAGLGMTLAGVGVASGLFGLLYLVGRLLFRQEALGLGDVKLAMLLGAMAGFPAVVWWLLLGSLFGAVGGLIMVVVRRSSLHDFMPYGTAMCLGAFVALFLDPPLSSTDWTVGV